MLQLQFITLPAVTLGVVVLTLLFVFFGVRASRRPRSDSFWMSLWGLVTLLGIMFSGILIIVSLVMFFPYQGKYLTIEHPSGTIASTSYSAGGVVVDGAAGTVYVLTLKGNPTQYIVNDDRATKYKVGDRINLACTLQWNYGAKDQWNCSLGDAR